MAKGEKTMDGEERYFAFLRYALRLADGACAEGMDWAGFFGFAQRQALVGVLFDGVRRLPKELAPPSGVLFQWMVKAEGVRKGNLLLNRATVRVYREVCASGFRCCILKGQGNALLYPNPLSRTPGDVDVWVGLGGQGLDERMERLRGLALSLAGGDGSTLDVSYYHIGLMSDGVEVELHPSPSVMASPLHNRRLQRWLAASAEGQFAHEVALPGDAGCAAMPTCEFNMVYQLHHLFHHHFYEGIGLRQFVDYLYVLRQWRSGGGDAGSVVASLRQLGLLRFAGAVMYVLHVALGLAEEEMLVPMDAGRGRLLMGDILRGGNFGQHDGRYPRTALGHNVQRLVRDLRLACYYPSEALCEPCFRLWHFFWRKKRERA